MVLDQFGEKVALPPNSSTTIQFTREEKLAVSTTALTEGVTPNAVGITMNQFQAVMSQYGNLVRLSDLAVLTAKHPVVQRTIFILGLNAAELYDTLIFNVITAGTTTYRPNGRAGNSTLLNTDVISYKDLSKMESTLVTNGARGFDDGLYAFVCAPDVYAALLNDPDFKSAAQLKAPEKIWRGEVGALGGSRIIRSNSPAFAASTQTVSGATATFYNSFAIGKFAYQVVDLQNLKVYVTPPGGAFDALHQNYRIGFKFAFNSVITNNNWLISAFSAGESSVNT